MSRKAFSALPAASTAANAAELRSLGCFCFWLPFPLQRLVLLLLLSTGEAARLLRSLYQEGVGV